MDAESGSCCRDYLPNIGIVVGGSVDIQILSSHFTPLTPFLASTSLNSFLTEEAVSDSCSP